MINGANMRTDQYPGLYCTLQQSSLDPFNFNLPIVFILSLLKKKAWHINIIDDYGIISKNTYCYKTLPDFIISQPLPELWGEIVFHDKVPLDYVECIVVEDSKFYEAALIVGNRYKLYTKSQFKNLETRKYIKDLYLPGKYTDVEPNFCYHNIQEDKNRFHTVENIVSTLVNSGYNKEQSENYVKSTLRADVLKFMFDMWKERLYKNVVSPHIVYPPY